VYTLKEWYSDEKIRKLLIKLYRDCPISWEIENPPTDLTNLINEVTDLWEDVYPDTVFLDILAWKLGVELSFNDPDIYELVTAAGYQHIEEMAHFQRYDRIEDDLYDLINRIDDNVSNLTNPANRVDDSELL